MNLISNGEYGNFREYEVNEDGSKGSKINTLRITPDTVFTESLSSFAWYTISDLLENLVTVDSIKIKPAKSTVKTGQSYTFKAKLTGQNKDLVTVTWQLKGNKSSSTTLKSGVLKVASGETAKTLKIIAYAGTEKAVLKVSVTQSSSSSGSSGSSTSSTSSSSSSSGSSSSSSSSYSDDDDTTTYTAAELKEAIADKEDELEEAKQELKEARINYKEAKKEVQAATIKATISGVVTLAYTADAMPTDSPAIIVRAEEGMYVKASVSELALDTVQVGGTITCTSWESGEEYEAVITEISEYPESSDSSDYYGTSNPNSSYYPIVAYIEDADGLIKDETVTITYNSQSMGTVSEDDIYLQKAYIKSDDGGKYVYKQGENGRLEKQYIQTGATVYGQYVEILSGITLEDYIAFPYGNNVKEGAKTEISDDEDDIIY
ncbi:MAG: hypothetical protein LUF92_09125 [Clostridiales bacterium]|nr:hypothetical protein [Clostridiales bacterium]